MHLSGRLGAGCHLELDLDAVDGLRLAGGGDVEGRHDHRDFSDRRGLPEATADLALGTALQRGSVHVGRPPRHRGSGVDVFLYRVLEETRRRQNDHSSGVDVGLRGHPEHTAEVIHVAVGVDHGHHRALTAVAAVEAERGRGRLGAHQRIDDDDAGIALDEGDVGQVQSANLVDAFDDLVETLLGGEHGLTPQARVNGVRCRTLEEPVGVVVPHHPPIGGGDHAGSQRTEESPVSVGEVDGVVKRQCCEVTGVGGGDGGGDRFHSRIVSYVRRRYAGSDLEFGNELRGRHRNGRQGH